MCLKAKDFLFDFFICTLSSNKLVTYDDERSLVSTETT